MKKILVFVLAISATLSFAQTQLTNLEFPDPMPSNPNQFFTFKGELYFIATDGRSGAEIWKSDGTVQNTILLKDLNLGRGNSVISNFVEFKDKMYFVASDGIHGYQLWSTTGSSQGTIRITEDLDHAVQELLVSGEFIYFLKKIGNSLEVWKSDGTATGTTLVKELVAIWNSPANLTSALGLVFFSAQPEGTNDTRVWRTDGTDEGTFPITAQLDGNGSGPSGTAHPTQFIEYNGALYLVARSSQLFPYPKTVGILKTDGTVAGTQPVLGIHEGNMDLIEYGEVVLHQNKLYFSLFDVDRNRYFIWESMGTSGTTKKIYDYSSDTYFSPSNLCASGNNLLFTSGNASGGTSLVNFDLVTSTPQVLNELTGPLDQPFFFWGEFDLNIITKGLGSDFFIKAIIDGYGAANLWRSNGTATGAIMLSDIYRFGDVKFFNDRLYFAGLSEENFELCSSDGTQSGTSMLKEINASVNGFVLGSQFIKVGNQVVFAAYTEEEGSE
jgi:ELWxxDGT repeat protein